MPWSVAAAVIGAGASIYSANQQADAAQNAANAQSAGTGTANAELARQFDITNNNAEPYRRQGGLALDKLSMLLGLSGGGEGYGSLAKPFTGSDFWNDPGVKFGLEQGTNTLQNSAAARGQLYSGPTGRALERYGTDYAGTKFNEAFNRNLQTKQLLGNQLAGLSGTGQTAVGQVGTIGANTANQIGQNTIGAANVQAAAQLASGSAYGGAANQIGGRATNYLRQQATANSTPNYGVGDPYSNSFVGPPASSGSYNYVNDPYYGPYQ
jgi:hypothetical protein